MPGHHVLFMQNYPPVPWFLGLPSEEADSAVDTGKFTFQKDLTSLPISMNSEVNLALPITEPKFL